MIWGRNIAQPYLLLDRHLKLVRASLNSYQKVEPKLITTEVKECESFYYAEDYHQQYLHDNPNGYCMHWNLGVI